MKKILVIEDEESVRDNILELLDVEGFHGLGAENGLAGVRLAREHVPDLIICDVMMPELDGYGVLQALRQDPVTALIPFVFLTAKASQADLRQGMDWGADDYLTKPFTRDDLLKAVATRLAKRLAVSQQLQEKLDDLRSNIVHSLPHEFLTPLSVILNASEILSRHHAALEPAEVPEIAARIYTAAERLHRLIRNYVLYAELQLAAAVEAKAQSLRSGGSATVTVIEDVARRKAKQFDRTADLRLALQDAVIPVSAKNLSKIAEELIDNAFRYSPAGTLVDVGGYSEGGAFRLSITDHGRGMTPGQIADVGAYMQFERDHYEQQGSGLGLAIARRLAELHGGELTIASVPGEHTTVRVTIPA